MRSVLTPGPSCWPLDDRLERRPVLLCQLVTQMLELRDEVRHAVVVDGAPSSSMRTHGTFAIRNHQCDDPRGNMSAHGWLLLISSVDSVVAAGTLVLIMMLRRWAGVYFAIALAAAVVLILSLTILLRGLGLA
jgi:hypothetical protein